MHFNVAMSRRSAALAGMAFKRPSVTPALYKSFRPRFYASDANAPLAQKFTINGDRLW